jgi:serine/threonine protein kinase
MVNLNRRCLEKNPKKMIKEGTSLKPDLYQIDLNGKAIIVKDIYHKNFFYRWTIGLWLIKKEWKIYLRLKGIKGIPKVFNRIDRFSFSMEYINGREIRRGEKVSASFFVYLKKIIDEIHAKGVVHLDLRHKGNILVNEHGEPFLIDFNSALYFKRNGILKRFLFPILTAIDYGGFLKLKQRVSPSTMSPEEIALLKKINWLRNLWIFN